MALGSTTSSSVVQLGIGPKAFVVADASAFQAGQQIRALFDQSHYIDGTVTGIEFTTRTLTVNITSVIGSGVYSRWTITLNDQPSIGSTGATGASGATGPDGPRGLVGASGIRGFTGSAGAAAAMGATGVQGPRGATGIQGATGFIGFTGSRGNSGFVGSVGSGFTGSAGVGFTGSRGAGYAGSAGTPGLPGFTGSGGTGYAGSAGLNGATGATGAIGATGPSGGYTGSAGTPGFVGSFGFTGSEGLRGVPGNNGATGLRGYTGSAGAGFTGSVGFNGSVGFVGSAGTSGAFSGNVNSHLLPTADVTYNLGSRTQRWKELWLSNNTLYLGDTAVTPTAAGLATTETLEGGENLAIGMYFVQWTNTQKLKIRTSTTSSFNDVFLRLKRDDSFELITGTPGNFPSGTILKATSGATKVSGGSAPNAYYDWTIPVDVNGTNQYVYKFFLTRAPVTDINQLNDSSGLLSNTVSSNVNSNLIPTTDLTYNLGSPTRRWKELYLSNNTLYLGNTAITPTATGVATTETIEGGEALYAQTGIAYTWWKSTSKLDMRLTSTSQFNSIFSSLKKDDTITLISGITAGGTPPVQGDFPDGTVLTVTGPAQVQTNGLFKDWSIPVDLAGSGSFSQYVYKFSVTRVPVTDVSQLADSTGILSTSGNVSALASRTTPSASTTSIATNANTSISVTGFKGYYLYKIQVNVPAWVRIYTNSAARTADMSRSRDVDPAPDAGVIAEVITTTNNQTVTLSPAVIGFNDENPVTDQIPLYVTNLSGSSTAVTVTLTIVKTEA